MASEVDNDNENADVQHDEDDDEEEMGVTTDDDVHTRVFTFIRHGEAEHNVAKKYEKKKISVSLSSDSIVDMMRLMRVYVSVCLRARSWCWWRLQTGEITCDIRSETDTARYRAGDRDWAR